MSTAATIPTQDSLLIEEERITPLMVDEYRLWFINSPSFYIQNPYLVPADEKAKGYGRVDVPITRDHVRRHLIGHHTIGCYTLNPESTCKWFALDGDYTGAENHLDTLAEKMRDDGLFPVREDSRRGGHLWIFCDQQVPARLARIYLYTLLDENEIAIHGVRGNKDTGIEIFPKQESLEPGQVGNGLRGPLGIHRKKGKRYWFFDAEPNIEDQFRYLRSVQRCSLEQLELLTEGLDMPEDLKEPEWAPPDESKKNRFGGFEITLYVDQPRRKPREGGKFVTQCPSCAEVGGDRSRNNLSITPRPEQTSLYNCFKGCTSADIVAACRRKL